MERQWGLHGTWVYGNMPVYTVMDLLMDTADFLSRKEAARYLTRIGRKISFYTLNNLASNGNKGHGPRFMKFGNRTVYRREDLDKWVMETGRVVE